MGHTRTKATVFFIARRLPKGRRRLDCLHDHLLAFPNRALLNSGKRPTLMRNALSGRPNCVPRSISFKAFLLVYASALFDGERWRCSIGGTAGRLRCLVMIGALPSSRCVPQPTRHHGRRAG